MQSRHDMESFAAKLDNVQLFMPELWDALKARGCYDDSKVLLFLGACVYKIPKLTFMYDEAHTHKVQCERRVIRLPLPIYKARGDRFQKPVGDRERRDSDVRTLKGYRGAHRLKVKEHTASK